MSIEISLIEAQELLDYFGDDDPRPLNSRPGLYVYLTDYPEEGVLLLGPETL